MRHSARTRRSGLLLVLCAGLLVSACASSGPSLEIGFRRIALDLAFKDAELAEAVDAPTVVRRLITADPVEVVEAPQRGPRRVKVVRVVAPQAPETECIPASDGTAPDEPAFAVIKEPPTPGVYERRNEGGITLLLGTSEIDIPVPPTSKWEIPSVEEVKGVPEISDADAGQLGMPEAVTENENVATPMVEFSLTRRLTLGNSVTDTYRYTNDNSESGSAAGTATGDYLHLVRRVTVADGEESVFQPTPPIRLVRLNAPEGPIEESGVVHGGVDRDTNVSMTVQSQIVARELVDVCGEVVDTYRVQIKESFVDLVTGETSGNEGDTANYWNVQFDKGLLIVREEVNSTLRTTTEVAGAPVPVEVRYRYTSTLRSLEPDPLPDEPAEVG